MYIQLYMYVHKTSSPFVFVTQINYWLFSWITEVLFNDFVFQY